MENLPQVSVHEFNDRLRARAKELRIPFQASLELTYACNFRCVHCFNPHHESKDDLGTEFWKSVLGQLAGEGCLVALFTGGEPLVRKDLFDLLAHARNLGMQCILNTNGLLLDPEKIQRLEESGLTLLAVSVFGMSVQSYESVTRIPGSFARFLLHVEQLRRSRIPLLFKMPVMQMNYQEVEYAKDWFSSRGLLLKHTSEIQPRADGDPEPLQHRISSAQAADLRFRYEEDLGCGKRSPRKDEFFDCQCGKSAVAITPRGEMNLCVSFHYPRHSLLKGSVREGWKRLVDFAADFKPSEKYECPGCRLSPYCSRGAMDSWLNTGDFNPCVPYFKEVAGRIEGALKKRSE